jgi:hypothetical protein
VCKFTALGKVSIDISIKSSNFFYQIDNKLYQLT